MRTEKAVENLRKAKTEATRHYAAAIQEARNWELIIEDLDAEMTEIAQEKNGMNRAAGRVRLAIIVITALVLLTILFCTQGCQTLKGGLGDAAWISQKLSDNIVTEK